MVADMAYPETQSTLVRQYPSGPGPNQPPVSQ